jgi:3-methyladenine DNA glycosylase AlkD
MRIEEILTEITSQRDENALAGMARYGIKVDNAYGLSMPALRTLAKRVVGELGKRNPARHALALDLWATGIHEARLLATMVESPELVTEPQLDAWVAGLDSWDVCDQLCNNLIGSTRFAWDKALEWSARPEEFVKRAGFALMAVIAWHDKRAADERFIPFLDAIEREAGDDRNFVKKAVNWALRHIGKRNAALNRLAIERALRIEAAGSRSGRWIASDALRELESDAVRRRLGL